MLKLGKNLYLLTSLIFLFLSLSGFVFAQTQTPTPTPPQSSISRLEEINNQIRELQGKISSLQEEEKSLSSQIEVLDSQIELSELRIDATQTEINNLEEEISIASKKVGNLEGSIDNLTEVLLNRIVATYQIGSVQPIQILLSSNTVSDFVKRANYLRLAQAHDKKLIYETQQARNDYANQREISEGKKARVESLKKQLEEYTAQLDSDKIAKEELLRVTRNDEARFQQELARLRADAESISRALGNIGYKIGTVSKGEVIAGVGSSGCSTGPHLHLEVFTDARVEGGRIVGNRVDPKSYLENGAYEKPVPGYPGNVTTWYGEVYFLGTHTGIDMAAPFNTPIRAMEGGEAYFTSAPCNANIAGGSSLGKGIVVDHKNGIVSLYWHIP